jgi:hypothetical protein
LPRHGRGVDRVLERDSSGGIPYLQVLSVQQSANGVAGVLIWSLSHMEPTNTTKMGTLGKILGVLQIVIAVYNFDSTNTNQIAVSILLFFGAWTLIFFDTESKRLSTINRTITRVMFVAAVAFILKILIFG